jgi:hypothetical protein
MFVDKASARGYFRTNNDAKGLTVLDDHLSRKRNDHVYTLTKEAVWI